MLRVGIFFGGSAREREISFAGGRTVYDNLDRTLFDAIPIFVDSQKQFILLNSAYMYKGSIRDFFPTGQAYYHSKKGFLPYSDIGYRRPYSEWLSMAKAIGRPLLAQELKAHIDIAFLALHGTGGEDGSIQGLLEYLQIPYTGSDIFASALGMDKVQQKKWMKGHVFTLTPYAVVSRTEWLRQKGPSALRARISAQLGDEVVVKPAREGSSIGASYVHLSQPKAFSEAVDKAFFIARIKSSEWQKKPFHQKEAFIRHTLDLRQGVGLPAYLEGKEITHPDALYKALDAQTGQRKKVLCLEGMHSETEVLIETYLEGDEFSCIVIEDSTGQPHALLPTGISRTKGVYDYQAKYLSGSRRKQTPLELPAKALDCIRKGCESLYRAMKLQVYARMDGFYTSKGLYLNDPNTTSGLLPSSFVFQQAAWAGLSPSDFLTYVIERSVVVRNETNKQKGIYDGIVASVARGRHSKQRQTKTKVAVLTGGTSSERHVALESGRNIYEKLAASARYDPRPLYLSVNTKGRYTFYSLPLALLYKDHADDIHAALQSYHVPPYVKAFQKQMAFVLASYQGHTEFIRPCSFSYARIAKDFAIAFIALHGRPGEDGTIQRALARAGIAYTGSNPKTAALAIDKHATAMHLSKHGFNTPKQCVLKAKELTQHSKESIARIEKTFTYPIIAKPVDDGCSTGVQKLNNRSALKAYIAEYLSKSSVPPAPWLAVRQVPQDLLIEEYIGDSEKEVLMEITLGVLARKGKNGQIRYEALVPSEVKVQADVLTLEEKFLAGEGQNITPARIFDEPQRQKKAIQHIQHIIEEVARCLHIEGYARIDAFIKKPKVSQTNAFEMIILEVNTLPGLTPATCLFHQAAYKSMTPYALLDFILSQARPPHVQT